MLDRLFNIRLSERRDAWSAFFVLFVFVGSFAVLETARDALFLASIDAAHLPGTNGCAPCSASDVLYVRMPNTVTFGKKAWSFERSFTSLV